MVVLDSLIRTSRARPNATRGLYFAIAVVAPDRRARCREIVAQVASDRIRDIFKLDISREGAITSGACVDINIHNYDIMVVHGMSVSVKSRHCLTLDMIWNFLFAIIRYAARVKSLATDRERHVR